MSGGFEANVPARKPRTKIARVISELTSGPQGGAEGREDRAVTEDAAPQPRETVADVRRSGALDEARLANVSVARVTRPVAAPPQATTAPASPAAGGREQIARLRERLAATTHLRSAADEPKRTAAAVREVVDGLRDRLETSARERSDLAAALEDARTGLARAHADLQKERRAREALEAQAEARRRIADDAVAEAEALAAERDQVLGELAELRRLEGERTGLLTEIEAALAERDAERQAAARELAEAHDLADLHAAEVADLETRLQEEATSRARAEARCKDLEAEVARMSEAREALESIEDVLGHRRGNRGDNTR